jgi:DNA-binding response OmpR family regulator
MSSGDSGQIGTSHRLLVIDDEPGITRLIEAAARALGLEVRSINDTNDFEKALATFEPTIILLDVSMPERDGVELIAYLSNNNYSGKVAIMSGTDPRYIQMSSTIAKAKGLNVAGTLTKPFRMQAAKDLLTQLASEAS